MATLSDFTDGDLPGPTASGTRINAFELTDGYVFKHYFGDSSVFRRLDRFYNSDTARFEIPRFEYPSVKSFLDDHDYRLLLVDDIERYVVAVKKYTRHPDRIKHRSVCRWSDTTFNYFLLPDLAEVEWAVMDGASRVANADHRFDTDVSVETHATREPNMPVPETQSRIE